MPSEQFMYLGDTARLPYGTKSPATVKAYALQAAGLLVQRGVKALVVACNTASAFALNALIEAYPDLPVIGVVNPGAQAATALNSPNGILVLATESTIKGGAYQRALLRGRAQVAIYGRACPLWVTLAEMSSRSKNLVDTILANDLRGHLGPNSPDTVLLGCTHFPVFKTAIATLFHQAGRTVQLVDSATTTAKVVHRTLLEIDQLSTRDDAGSAQFLATDGVARFVEVGQQFLPADFPLGEVELVDLR